MLTLMLVPVLVVVLILDLMLLLMLMLRPMPIKMLTKHVQIIRINQIPIRAIQNNLIVYY